jgi:hypothetical protein
MTAQWRFPENNGETEGPQNAAINTFKGNRLVSLVRETIQNALDVRVGTDPVIVSFTLDSINPRKVRELSEFSVWLERAASRADLLQNPRFAEHYREGKSALESDEILVLGVHDFNTTGLTGPTVDDSTTEPGAWLALVKSTGLSSKANLDAGGSFGHGSKAPFAVGKSQAVFYYTELASGEARFEGKAILLSMPYQDRLTRATGYFGIDEQHRPLINEDIPMWARNMRVTPPGGSSTGTSILIPDPLMDDSKLTAWELIEIAVQANFARAIRTRNLVVRLGDSTVLDANTIDEYHERLESLTQAYDGKLDQVIKTYGLDVAKVLAGAPDQARFSGEIDLGELGSIPWLLSIDDDWQNAKVAFVRRGMFITADALQLSLLRGLKPCRLILCVEENTKVSELLRSLENPTHDGFEFDRIDNQELRKDAERKYSKLVTDVKRLLAEHAGIELSDEDLSSDLDFLFGDNFRRPESNPGAQRSRSLTTPGGRKAKVEQGEPVPTPDSSDRRGTSGGDKEHKTQGGNFPTDEGEGDGEGLKVGTYRQVKNLRIVPIGDSGEVDIHFYPVVRGNFRFQLVRSGETDRVVIPMEVRGEWVSATNELKNSNDVRKTLRVKLRTEDLAYALEGVMISETQG